MSFYKKNKVLERGIISCETSFSNWKKIHMQKFVKALLKIWPLSVKFSI